MKVAVELYQIREGETGGVVPFLLGLLEAIIAGHADHQVILFCSDQNETVFRKALPAARIVVLPAAHYLPMLDVSAAALGVDVLFRSYPLATDLGFPTTRQVVLVPDVQHEYFPDFFAPETLAQRRAAFSQTFREAGAIVTLSEHARQCILRHTTADQDVRVTSPGLCVAGTAEPPLTEDERRAVPHREFFFYPANLWPHKNHHRTLQAFRSFLSRIGRPFEFVLTGHPSGWEKLRDEFADLPLRHLGYVRRPLLDELMRRARALVFCSLFEGFGMPLLEAFHAGTPVICSNTTSLPEIGGDAVLLCDPTDVGAIADAMTQVAGDPVLRERLTRAGKSRRGRFQWAESAVRFVEVCERLAARPVSATGDYRSVQLLTEMIRSVDADRAARLAVITQLETALTAARADQAARLALIHRLDAALRDSEADRSARLAVIHQLDAAVTDFRSRLAAAEANVAAKVAEIRGLEAAARAGDAARAAQDAVIRHLSETLGRLPGVILWRFSRRVLRVGRRAVRSALGGDSSSEHRAA